MKLGQSRCGIVSMSARSASGSCDAREACARSLEPFHDLVGVGWDPEEPATPDWRISRKLHREQGWELNGVLHPRAQPAVFQKVRCSWRTTGFASRIAVML